jgi:hypothetical protein
LSSGLLQQLEYVPGAQDLVRLLKDPSSSETSIASAARRLAEQGPTAQLVISDLSLSVSEIRAMWEENRNRAAHQGTQDKSLQGSFTFPILTPIAVSFV